MTYDYTGIILNLDYGDSSGSSYHVGNVFLSIANSRDFSWSTPVSPDFNGSISKGCLVHSR